MFQGTIIRNEPAFRPRPEFVPEYHKFTKDQYTAFVSVSALEHIAHDARQTAPNETIGLLVGRPFRDGQGHYAIVTDAFTATSARRGPVNVETSFDDERRLVNTLTKQYPIAEKLGWWHSHPFAMPSYSAVDADNQRSWNEPYHLGLLASMDRGSQTVTIHAFRGPEGERLGPAYVSRIGATAELAAFATMAEEIPDTEVANRPVRSLFVASQEPNRNRWMRAAEVILGIAIYTAVLLAGVWWISHRLVEKRAQEIEARILAVQAIASQPAAIGSVAKAPATSKNHAKSGAKPQGVVQGQVPRAPKNSPPIVAKK